MNPAGNESSPDVWAAFARHAAAWGAPLTPVQLAAFQEYLAMLGDWNQRFNLTRITAPEQIVAKHFLDSLSCAAVVELNRAARLIDVGTGAGLPGLALKIAFPRLQVTLLDATRKRLRFCDAVADRLGLSDIEIVHARAEDAAHDRRWREAFDVATARAVAPLEALVEWLLPFARPGGECLALKGPDVQQELENALPVIAALGGGPPVLRRLELPIAPVGRSLIVIPKVRRTRVDYPRRGAAKKRPIAP